jgi:acyl-CoA reductase-like NAD-dependent aldehyde dehydrogenase
VERTELLIDGAWEAADTHLEVRDPWTGAQLAELADASDEQVDRAVAAAARVLEEGIPATDERAAVLDRVADLVDARAEDFTRTIAQEAGKPIRTARAEVARAVQTMRFSAAAARTVGGESIPMDAHPAGAGYLAFTIREPVGVLVAITPFNFPLNLVAHKLGPALAAGCPVVLKPADRTPLSSLRLVEAFAEAGLAPGMLNLVSGDGARVGGRLAADPRVAAISFTGSGPVGWQIRAAASAKRVLLELGSAAPLIVEADADLDVAAARIALHGFSHAGQSCVSVQRVLVHADVVDDLLAALLPRVADLRVGPPLEEDTDVSCCITVEAAERVESWIGEAVDAGGRLLAGGKRDGAVVTPAVLADVPAESRLACEEVFGPVVVVDTFTSTEEAIRTANAGARGLNAGVFTADVQRALRYVRGLRYGAVLVNEAPTFRVDHMPYGGEPPAGTTREGPLWSMRELTVEKLVVLAEGAP